MDYINEADFLRELTDFINAEDEANANISQEEIENNTFCIKNLNQADYILRRLNETKAEIEHVKALGQKKKDEYCEKVDRYIESNTKGALSSVAYLESLLRTFVEDYTKDKKSKSVKLPEGTLSLRAQKPKYIYDDAKLLSWLQENDATDYVKVKETISPDKDKLKKIAEIQGDKLIFNGKVIEGVDIVEQKDAFTVKASI